MATSIIVTDASPEVTVEVDEPLSGSGASTDAIARWVIRLYDLDGNPVEGSDMTVDQNVSNEIKHATNRNLSFYLNGIDSLSIDLYLDDPMAVLIKRLNHTIKVWRYVYDESGTLIYSDPDDTPCFAGIVATTTKSGEANIMSIKAFAPLWRLQSRFHLLNHYLKTNVDTASDYLQSELMWKLIDLVNNAFGLAGSYTGIALGTFTSSNDPVVAPKFIAKGSNTWINFNEIMSRFSGVDIVPEYHHVDGNATLMYFNTDEKRGTDLSGSIDFRYHTGTDDNLDDCVEDEQPQPGELANYYWAVGAGGPNSGLIAMEENVNDDLDGRETIGVYMRKDDFPDIKRIGRTTPTRTHLKAISQDEFAQARIPKTSYTITVSPAGVTYYGSHFSMGDVITLNADKGALSVTNAIQRIYEIQLNASDNNIETSSLTIASDFAGKVADV